MKTEPHLAGAGQDAYRLAGLNGVDDFDVAEIHDCFSANGIVTIERMGPAAPGTGGAVVAEGAISRGGRLSVNRDGGLLADGHPVGAAGFRIVFDATLQDTGRAADRGRPHRHDRLRRQLVHHWRRHRRHAGASGERGPRRLCPGLHAHPALQGPRRGVARREQIQTHLGLACDEIHDDSGPELLSGRSRIDSSGQGRSF